MTYNQARFRIGIYFLVSWTLRVFTCTVLLIAAARGFVALNETQGCGLFQFACNSLQSGIAYLVNNIFFLTWIWLGLPNVPPQFWYLALFSSLGICAAFFLLLTFFLDKIRNNLLTALGRALAEERVRRFHQTSYVQSIDSINVGRDLNIGKIEQNVSSNTEIRDWDNSFFRSPLGQIIIAAGGGLLSLLLGKLVGG